MGLASKVSASLVSPDQGDTAAWPHTGLGRKSLARVMKDAPTLILSMSGLIAPARSSQRQRWCQYRWSSSTATAAGAAVFLSRSAAAAAAAAGRPVLRCTAAEWQQLSWTATAGAAVQPCQRSGRLQL